MTPTETVRINIGHDGIMSSSDIVEETHDYIEDIEQWFENKDSKYQISIHHEVCDELGCILHCIDVKMEEEFVRTFRNYFA